MSYDVTVERRARKAVARLPSTMYDRVVRAIADLSQDPRPRQSRELESRPGRRLRVGNYRIVYHVDDDRREVFVAEVWHRQRDYR